MLVQGTHHAKKTLLKNALVKDTFIVFVMYVAYNLCTFFDELGHYLALQALGKPAHVEFTYQDHILSGLTTATNVGTNEQIFVILAGPATAITISALLYIALKDISLKNSKTSCCSIIILLMITLREAISFYPATYNGYANHGMMLNKLTGLPISYIPLLTLLSTLLLLYLHTTGHDTKTPSHKTDLPMNTDHIHQTTTHRMESG
ncbi:hypothetical protein FHEFKHOI_01664 [Candidatus Methanoperedenaceae archaeon GB50]|nr:hypothetical protein FHEFKHOI_01664 [Candidatus Methanoperedenaceae archaeon GB50]CAD7780317.1 MAG: hypothetical protein KBONHNOK_01449 [Candidatus Methanoperedenaceae archaeon GB50]